MRRSMRAVALLLATALLASCGDEGQPKRIVSPPGSLIPGSTQFTGYFADGSGLSGPITITIASASLAGTPGVAGRAPPSGANLISARATVDFGGTADTVLTGWYHSIDKTIELGSSGYVMFGQVDVIGSIPRIAGASGSASPRTAVFQTLKGDSTQVRVHCGILGNPPPAGNIGFARNGTTLVGVVFVRYPEPPVHNWWLYAVQGSLSGGGSTPAVTLGSALDGVYSFSATGFLFVGSGSGYGAFTAADSASGRTLTSTWDVRQCN